MIDPSKITVNAHKFPAPDNQSEYDKYVNKSAPKLWTNDREIHKKRNQTCIDQKTLHKWSPRWKASLH